MATGTDPAAAGRSNRVSADEVLAQIASQNSWPSSPTRISFEEALQLKPPASAPPTRISFEDALKMQSQERYGDVGWKDYATTAITTLVPGAELVRKATGIGGKSQYADDFRRTMAQGATFGWSDELAGRAKQLIGLITGGETDYRKLRDEERAALKEFEAAFPKTALGAEVAGGVLVPGGVGKTAAQLGVRQLATQGAKLGFIQGAGSSEAENINDLTGDAVVHGIGGAVLNPAVAKTVSGVGRVVGGTVRGVGRVADHVKDELADLGVSAPRLGVSVERAAERRLEREAQRAGLDSARLETQRAAEATLPGAPSLADVLGARGHALAEDAVKRAPAAAPLALAKQSRQGQRIADDVTSGVDDGLGVAPHLRDARRLADEIERDVSRYGDDAYNALRQAGTAVDADPLRTFGRDRGKIITDAYREAVEQLQAEGTQITRGQGQVPIDLADKTLRVLGSKIGIAAKGGDAPLAHTLGRLKDDFEAVIDGAGGNALLQIRQQMTAGLRPRDTLISGMEAAQAVKAEAAHEARNAFGRLTDPADIEHYRAGMAQGLRERIKELAAGNFSKGELFASDAQRQLFRHVLGDASIEQAEQLVQRLVRRGERNQRLVDLTQRPTVREPGTTPTQLANAGALAWGMHPIAAMAALGYQPLKNRLAGAVPSRDQILAEMLLRDSPEATNRLIGQLRDKETRAARRQAILELLAERSGRIATQHRGDNVGNTLAGR